MKTKLTRLFVEFFESEQASGIILILCTMSAVVIANSPLGTDFVDFWHIKARFEAGDLHLKYSLEHWINDGLMAIFFPLIGLEIERELYIGELSNPQNASLPIFAAIGGMLMPALLHLFFNHGTDTQKGFGIPMATDIAFALSSLASTPRLRVFYWLLPFRLRTEMKPRRLTNYSISCTGRSHLSSCRFLLLRTPALR